MTAQTDNVVSSIQGKFESMPESLSTRCIHKVPEYIRKVNKDCYKPSVVSIGPIHYKEKSLKQSQELKLMHLKCFLQLGTSIYGDKALSLFQYIEIIKDWEDEARSYYVEKINLPSNEFVEMMMIDAAFIIFHILSYNDENIPDLVEKRVNGVKVHQDMFLSDNQLPFFVLNQLYDIAFNTPANDNNKSFKDLVIIFLGRSNIPGAKAAFTAGRTKVREASDIKHLVDFWRICCIPPNRSQQQTSENNEVRLCCFPPNDEVRICCLSSNSSLNQNPENVVARFCCLPNKCNQKQNPKNNKRSHYFACASELKDAGVKFIAGESVNFLDIKFSEGVLQIPTLYIGDSTEIYLRSIMYFEQCHYKCNSYFLDYACFLDGLIDTSKDVEILVQHGIITSLLGSDEEVARMVNRILKNLSIITSNFYYKDISRRLNAYAAIRCNKWKAVLKRDYFNHPWSIISVAYLVVLLILTVLQVYTGFRG